MGLNGKRIRKFYESKKQAPRRKYTEWKEGRDTEKQMKQEAKQEAKKVYKTERKQFLISQATKKAKQKATKKRGFSLSSTGITKLISSPTSRGQPRSQNGWASFGGSVSDWADYSPKKIKTLSTKKKKRSDIFDLP